MFRSSISPFASALGPARSCISSAVAVAPRRSRSVRLASRGVKTRSSKPKKSKKELAQINIGNHWRYLRKLEKYPHPSNVWSKPLPVEHVAEGSATMARIAMALEEDIRVKFDLETCTVDATTEAGAIEALKRLLSHADEIIQRCHEKNAELSESDASAAAPSPSSSSSSSSRPFRHRHFIVGSDRLTCMVDQADPRFVIIPYDFEVAELVAVLTYRAPELPPLTEEEKARLLQAANSSTKSLDRSPLPPLLT